MIPLSTDSPAFLQTKPDFEQGVGVTLAFATQVMPNDEAGEQRAKFRNRPRNAIDYAIDSMGVAEFSARRSAALQELGKAVVVPMWPLYETLSSLTGADTANFAASIASRLFRPGGYAYFEQAGKVSTFRRIVSIGSTTLVLHATDAYPVPPIPVFTAGALVYPCVFGEHTDGVGWQASRLDSTDERVQIIDL